MKERELVDLACAAIGTAIKAAIVAFVVLKVAFWMGCFSGIIVVTGPQATGSPSSATVARR